MSDLKKEKEIKKVLDAEYSEPNPLNTLSNVVKNEFGSGGVLTVFVYTRTPEESVKIINGVAPDIKQKTILTMDDLQEMIKDSSVTLTQESANELQRLIDNNDKAGLVIKMLSMPEFKDKLLQRLVA